MRHNTFPGPCCLCHQQVPAGAGTVTRAEHGWEVAHDGPCPANPHNPDNSPVWLVRRGSGDGGEPYRVGAVVRARWWRAAAPAEAERAPGLVTVDAPGKQVSGLVLITAAHQQHFAEDGLTYGAGEDEGYLYSAWVRVATEAEAAPVLAAEAEDARRTGLARRVRALLAFRFPGRVTDAEYLPAGTAALEGVLGCPEVPLRPATDVSTELHPDRVLLDVAGGAVWTVVHNGADSDDWAMSNIARHIALRHPLTPERAQLCAELTECYAGEQEWQEAGIPAAAARALRVAGWGLPDLLNSRLQLRWPAVEDVTAFLTHPVSWWAEAGWSWSPGAARRPAVEALRLAEAGIGAVRAAELAAAGHSSVEQMLTARPPRLPREGGRWLFPGGGGRLAVVADDPDIAQQLLERDPARWGTWQHTLGIRLVHAAQEWQLWDDGSLTVRTWWRGRDGQARPQVLTAAAVTALTLTAGARNVGEVGRAVWHPLREAVEHQEHRVEHTEFGGHGWGVELSVWRHNFGCADAVVRQVWELREQSWESGEDGDARQVHWLHAEQDAAVAAYRKRVASR